jgi:hypothetical protein
MDRMPRLRTRRENSSPYAPSRSRIMNLGAWKRLDKGPSPMINYFDRAALWISPRVFAVGMRKTALPPLRSAQISPTASFSFESSSEMRSPPLRGLARSLRRRRHQRHRRRGARLQEPHSTLSSSRVSAARHSGSQDPGRARRSRGHPRGGRQFHACPDRAGHRGQGRRSICGRL